LRRFITRLVLRVLRGCGVWPGSQGRHFESADALKRHETTKQFKRDRKRLLTGRGLHSPTFQLNLSLFGHTSRCPPI